MTATTPAKRRIGLVLSGGGARGAYEAGVLAYLLEEIYPELPEGFEFDLLSGSSVGAIHAAYMAASAHIRPVPRAQDLVETWSDMRVRDVLQVSAADLFGIPFRALGVTRLAKRLRAGAEVLGGLVDITPLERIVSRRIPWAHLEANLATGRPGVLCISSTQVRSGRVHIFLDGPLADPEPWDYDPNATADIVEMSPLHVRASAAIPFFFPAVRIGDRYYLDGGLRMNAPLSPALRLGCDRLMIVGLKHIMAPTETPPAYPEEVIGQPAFLIGKVLNALLLDRLEYDIQRVELVNALIEHGETTYGSDFLEKINEAVRAKRGVDYRRVRSLVLSPSRDLGVVAAECYAGQGASEMGLLPRLLTAAAQFGMPEGEADLLSYLLFDRCYTLPVMEMGREDARAHREQILELLLD